MSEQPWPSWPAGTRLLRVADVIIDLSCRELERDSGTVELQQRVFDLLLVMLREPYVLHTRAALFGQVWPGVVVEDASLSQAVWMLRRALGDERRHWIRTIPKRGYLFEPPEPPRAVDTLQPVAPPRLAPAPIAPNPSTTTPRPAWRRRGMATALAALLPAVLAVAAAVGWRQQPAPLDDTPVAIAVLQVGDGDPGERWPALLLQAWLEWKLSTLPEVEVVDGARLAADAPVVGPHVVLLSAGMVAGPDDGHYVRARVDTRDGPRQLEMRGRAGEVPRLVDAISYQVLELLLPARAGEPWPSLQVAPEVARAYADAWQAYTARDMAAAAQQLEEVLSREPGFGLAHLQLGLARARLGQARAAGSHLVEARTLLRPLGMDSERLMAARELSVDPGRAAEAAQAFSRLAREYPGRLSLRLDQAAYLIRANDPDAATAALEGPEWRRQSLALRIRWRMVMADIAAGRADPHGVREHAGAAEQLALRAGREWDRERAAAVHLLAQAGVFEHGPDADVDRFEEAAALFAATGAERDALYARVNASLARPGAGDGEALNRLLAQSRVGGYRGMEIRLLRKMAYRHHARAEFEPHRQRLEEALAMAAASGDAVARQEIELDLLHDDLMGGRLDLARERIRRVRAGSPDGDRGAWLDQFEAIMLALEADYAGAVATLDGTAQRLRRERREPLPASTSSRLACDRAAYLLPQGRMDAARKALEQCARHPQASTALRLPALAAEAGLLAGDTAAARSSLQVLSERIAGLPPGPQAWIAGLHLAYLQVRLGEAAQALPRYRSITAALEGSSYAWMQAEAALGHAEALLALGEWKQVAPKVDQAEGHLPGMPWTMGHRGERARALAMLGSGDVDAAAARLAVLHEHAHQRGDVVAQLELHSLAGHPGVPAGCDVAAHRAQVVATGLRGAHLDWVAAPRRAHVAAEEPLTRMAAAAN